LLLSLQYLLSLVYALGSKQRNETLRAEANVHLRPHSTYRVNQAAHTHQSQHRLTAERPLTSYVVELFIYHPIYLLPYRKFYILLF